MGVMPLASQTIHIATDWPAFGLFFLALIGTFGTFTSWVIRRLERNRKSWQEFVTKEVDAAKAEFRADLTQLRDVVSANSRELFDQGKAVARIEGALNTYPAPRIPPV